MKRALVLCLIVGAGAAGYIAAVPPPGPRTIRQFDPSRMADLELRMWQAYYNKEKVRLFALLVTALREQYHYSWIMAARQGFHLARAAAAFGDAKDHYEDVLPDLEAAYGAAKDWLHAGFDPHAVARAELAWWVARRLPGQNSPLQVGSLMADEYSLLYQASRERVARAALLRAEAAALRDADPQHPDWETIGDLLRRSYRELLAGLSSTTAGLSDSLGVDRVVGPTHEDPIVAAFQELRVFECFQHNPAERAFES
jgi:hypothetical protein